MTVCAVPKCVYKDRHKKGCDDGDCKGCMPRRAEEGRQLCQRHISGIVPDLYQIAEYWPKLQERKRDGGNGGDGLHKLPAGSKMPIGAALLDAIQMGDNVVSYLTHIALDEWNGSPPSSLDTGTLATWLARRHGGDIAATQDSMLAADIVKDLHEAARQAKYQADPDAKQVIGIPGTCIKKDEDGTVCGGGLRAVLIRDDDLLPSVIQCTLDPEHQYRAHEWNYLGRMIA